VLAEDDLRELDRAALWQVAAVGPEEAGLVARGAVGLGGRGAGAGGGGPVPGLDQHELVVEGLVVLRAVQSGSDRSLAALNPSKLC
jgi:hypothetical protein